MRKLGEGTFSEVLKAESVKTRQKVAIKCMKSHFDNIEQVRTSLAVQLKYFKSNLNLTSFLGPKSERNKSFAKVIAP